MRDRYREVFLCSILGTVFRASTAPLTRIQLLTIMQNFHNAVAFHHHHHHHDQNQSHSSLVGKVKTIHARPTTLLSHAPPIQGWIQGFTQIRKGNDNYFPHCNHLCQFLFSICSSSSFLLLILDVFPIPLFQTLMICLLLPNNRYI